MATSFARRTRWLSERGIANAWAWTLTRTASGLQGQLDMKVFATFEAETDYFGARAQQTMLNFRVRDLDAMLAQLRAKGANVDRGDRGDGRRRSIWLGQRSGGQSNRTVAALSGNVVTLSVARAMPSGVVG